MLPDGHTIYIVNPRACPRSHAQVGGGSACELCSYNNYVSGWHTQSKARSTHNQMAVRLANAGSVKNTLPM